MLRPSSRAVLCLMIAFPLFAQEPPSGETASAQKVRGKVGVGITLSPMAVLIDSDLGFLPLGLNNFVIPIQIGPNSTLEPEFGIFRSSSESSGGSTSFNNLRLGLGVLAGMKERAGLQPYLGPRFAISRTTQDQGGGVTTKQTTWFFSAVFGAQHFFSQHFSLGGELQLTRASVGETEASPAPPFPSPNQSQSFITSGGVMMLRWFF